MNCRCAILLCLTGAYLATAPAAQGQTGAGQTPACPTTSSVTGQTLPTVTQPCTPVPLGGGGGQPGRGLSQGYLASIIPTPGLTNSSVCGTTGVRCAADASISANGAGRAEVSVSRGVYLPRLSR